MPVDGASTTKCAVVLQLLALMKLTGFRLAAHSVTPVCACELFCSAQTNTTYLDVCPLLEPSPSTPSGDYVQPVGVDRDIELQTRNLPAPVSLIFGIYIPCVTSFHCLYMFHLLAMQISGFRYICSLRGTVNLPTVCNNKSSLTCRVNQNEVMHWGQLLKSYIGKSLVTLFTTK